MPKGPRFVEGNAARHQSRNLTWWEQCATVDVEALRVHLSVEYVRHNGGLSHEDRKLLKAKIAAIQRPKEKRERRLDQRREREQAT